MGLIDLDVGEKGRARGSWVGSRTYVVGFSSLPGGDSRGMGKYYHTPTFTIALAAAKIEQLRCPSVSGQSIRGYYLALKRERNLHTHDYR